VTVLNLYFILIGEEIARTWREADELTRAKGVARHGWSLWKGTTAGWLEL